MRVETVATNLSCNQNCRYCGTRASRDDPRFVHPRAVSARLRAAVERGAEEVVLSGGEPLLRRDAAALVAEARAAGARRVTLETNAALATPEVARALAAAGLAAARVNVSGDSPALDETTRDPGGFEATARGIRALLEAGVAVEGSVALVRSTRERAARVPALLARLGEGARGEVLGVRLVVPVEAPDPTELLRYDEVAPLLEALDREGRAARVPACLAVGDPTPPCVVANRLVVERLFRRTFGDAGREGLTQQPGCARCVLADRCSGVPAAYAARDPSFEVRPFLDDRVRRRLAMVGTPAEQMRRELETPSSTAHGVTDVVVRVGFRCNQTCDFCFVSTHLPEPPDALVRAAIERAADSGARVVLSGGEPTLSPRLGEWIALAAARSRLPVELQTNATLLGEPGRVEALVAAGLRQVFVSLHGATAETSDAVTGAPGTFEKTLAGLDRIAAAPELALALNFVLCVRNLGELPAFVELVARRWPSATVNLSFVGPSTDLVPNEAWLVPRYADAMPVVAAALARASALGVLVTGFESQCGLPLCLVPGDPSRFLGSPELPEDGGGGEFVRAEACGPCALRSRCWGIRRRYAEVHGLDEVRTVRLSS